jgi:hypothetical protein
VSRAGLYLHALRAARPRQLARRASRPVRRRLTRSGPAPGLARALPGGVEFWRSPAFESIPLDPAGAGTRLYSFHEQYGENVLAAARARELDAARGAAHEWIATHPPGAGDAWHPYALSTRVGNWIAAGSLEQGLFDETVSDSLWRQLRYLSRNVEDDVLGNHVIRNARALALGGAAFGDGRLTARARRLLRRELPEQLLPDGGHYERSPVYHLVVLRDLLELRAACSFEELDEPIERMQRFAAALTRPDGAPALFNDGTLDLAPQLDLPEAPLGLTVFPETGYAVVRADPIWLAFDCGPAAPDFLPAHAHADALSFQLWIDGQPVVVDPGTSTYEAGAERDRERSTAAHATVGLGGTSQFEPWGAFRSGPLPRVRLLDVAPLVAEVVWPSGARHRRTLSWDDHEVRVDDEVDLPGRTEVVSSLPLATGARIEVEHVGELRVETEERLLSERLFAPQRGTALAARGEAEGRLTGGWRISLSR